ncbi:alpha/beta fold hydrolase [Lederbergia citri]|uniref:Alpha/beta hydrolase n=1 Tax=Lederbergia citri TaxID=2833580 RepID=A0A942TAD9_9BACI|nr:alpha/beta hydrolase [Lederbergia citri]MBS4194171.1 alpha/beta hydrolase [Lederbergia citri]
MHTSFVTSKDGTNIGYREIGQGPGLIIVHGTMETSLSHSQLAKALSDNFTVYLYDRRGRGLSGPYRDDHVIQKEVEDLEAVLSKTGALFLFGVSAGALICLQAALNLTSIDKAALFDPPLIIDGSVSSDFMVRYDKEIADGDLVSALVTAMLGGQMGPPIFNSVPRWLLKMLTKIMLISDERHAKKDNVTMKMLAPTIHYDFNLSFELEDKLECFNAIDVEVLLLGTGKSPQYFKTALDALTRILPHAERVDFPELNHGASGNKNRGGNPERVAQELVRFFKTKM